MAERFDVNPFARFNVAALALQHDKAVAEAERAENVRALMTGGGHHQLAVRVALQNTALKIEAARGLFQPRGGPHPQAGRLKRTVLTGELRQQRLYQLTTEQRRDRCREALADWIEHGRRIRFELFWRGSEEALAELGRDECEMAGFHVPENWSVEQLDAWLRRWLDPARHVCLPVMRRRQGLIVARGNPHKLQTLADVSRRGLRMVNRQRGSGTRSMIDQLLAANNLRPESIAGYNHEEFTHEAIAATVATGQADVGFGIEAAAARYDLSFVPLVTERYGFAMSRGIAESPEGRAFLTRVRGNTFRQRLLAMPGYEPLSVREPGVWVDYLA